MPADQEAIWLLDQGFDGVPEEFLQGLYTMPEMFVSSYPELVQREHGHLTESIDPTDFIGTSVAKDTELTRAFRLPYRSFCEEKICVIVILSADTWIFGPSMAAYILCVRVETNCTNLV